MSGQPQWTIAIVNYKTSSYMKWQLKCFYEFNDPSDFRLVIIDNSRDEAEKETLLGLLRPYQDQFNNIDVSFYVPKETTASGQHGEALTLILKEHAHTKYILFQDPDFFWVKQDILKWFASFLEHGKVAVGAPYPCKVGVGHPDFPCAYGCAHKIADIKHLDLMADASEEARQKSYTLYPLEKGWGFSFDVGWKLRDALSSADHAGNFVSFKDKVAREVNKTIGRHSFETITRKYLYGDKVVGYHLFRGSFTGAVTADHADPNRLTPQEWLEAREKFSELFYQILKNNGVLPYRMQKELWYEKFYTFILSRQMSSLIRLVTTPLKKTKAGQKLVDFAKAKIIPH